MAYESRGYLKMKIRPIAIYLPQFHPVPENDEWWGKGFTEWRNVAKAKPLFEGHYQPHLPADLGFYDLRLSEAREAQATLAKEYGIYGFYYHYWFNGKRILERPFQEVFESGKPDFPFMLCWANENWTRRWDGQDQEVLLKQEHSEEDDRKHIRALLPYFKDDRYIKVDGKPVFAIYRSTHIPALEKTIRIWREEAAKEGIELYICRFENFGQFGKSYLECGFDAAIEFQPFAKNFYLLREQLIKRWYKGNSGLRVCQKFLKIIGLQKKAARIVNNYLEKFKDHYDYNEFVDYNISHPCRPADYTLFPGATPSWDNTARRGNKAAVFTHANPGKFKEWLMAIKQGYNPADAEKNFIFINAWNEWAEGNHLEPCQKWGTAYLEAIREVFGSDH
jgi:lipopolysaccharide biosynthesis protein